MIKPEDIAVGAIVRLKSGSPKFTVRSIDHKDDGIMVTLFGWADRLGFVQETVPLEFLVWPKSPEDAAWQADH